MNFSNNKKRIPSPWLMNSTNNIISSLIASAIFTLIFYLFNRNASDKQGWIASIQIVLVFFFCSLCAYFLIRYYIKKKYKPIKAIVFDFDGTLARCKVSEMKSSWEVIWNELGYKTSDCEKLYKEFKAKQITHQEWCDKTCVAFKKKNLDENTIKKVAAHFELYKNVKEVLEKLKQREIKLYLVSGSILQLIREIWKDELYDYFNECKANKFRFQNGKLEEIIGTRYDFEGKAQFIREIYSHLNLNSPSEILFIGNSDNDLLAYKSGARTLCLNAKLVNPDDKKRFHNSIKTENFEDLYNLLEKEYL